MKNSYISSLFNEIDVEKIKNKLKKLISIIEKSNNIEQEILLNEVVEEANKTYKNLLQKCKVTENLTFFNENIAPLALLSEEISVDAENNEDVLKSLKFNLNNYFNQLNRTNGNECKIEIENIKHVIDILQTECSFFDVLENHGVHLSIMMFNNIFRKCGIEVVNYNEIHNKKIAMHCFHCKELKVEKEELLLEYFGYVLKEIVVGDSQKAPNGFIELLDQIDELGNIDDESKELTSLFANCFAHYIIEKMKLRVIQEYGKDTIKHISTRNDEFVKKLLQYFDNLFEKLLKQDKEWDDNEKCPCGSNKRYKNCCKKKKIKYYKSDKEGHYIKSIEMHEEVKKALDIEKLRFKKLFGRTPGDEDYVIGGTLIKDIKRVQKIIKRENVIENAFLYAGQKTGHYVINGNKDFVSKRDEKEFAKYMYEYKRLMKSKIKGGKWNILQAVEATNFILESMLKQELPNMIYVLNLCVNYYSKDVQQEEKFIINNIKDFLVFCAYKTSLQLTVLEDLVSNEYYDTAMAEVRIIYEILITMKAYKNKPEWFEKKILSLMGVELGTHKKVKNTKMVEEIKTGKRYKYDINKRDLAKEAGDVYLEIYDKFYHELSGFIHLDPESAKGIFQESDMFTEIDECLLAGFFGMNFSLEIILELISFEGSNKKIDKDLRYFTNPIFKDFVNILPTIYLIENKEIYHLLEKSLKQYNMDYKINYQRNNRCEMY